MNKQHIVINGGGMVGATLAILLAEQGRQVTVIEASDKDFSQISPEVDLRVSAISASSQQLLQQVGAWPLIAAQRHCPYMRLSTWQQGGEALTFDAADIQAPLLGYIIENQVVQASLWQVMVQYDTIKVLQGQGIQSFTNSASGVMIQLADGNELQADLLVGADGAHSFCRQHGGIGITAWDYRQSCMLVHIKTDSVQQDMTWQEFVSTGPRAFLPLAGQDASLAWYHQNKTIAQMAQYSNEQLKQAILQEFAPLKFDFEVVKHGAFPLVRRHAQQYYLDSLVLVGDAAHTINPLAGQGVNLGFKDVQALAAELLLTDLSHQADKARALADYQSRRRPDNLLMQTAMDVFYKGFSCKLPGLSALRQGALTLAQHAGPIKHQVMKYAMGL
ncbi:FAD-dependent monooxygenase [Motilimonas pumila]|uniref:FAD-binding domain-containing protein n=1 Tax=Motilimonas pumila TaxID=2303987 RepID=A0A418YJT4_9GAMM|nr:FAD-dependent monooxygenase [Motilimonas pumila]RJG51223.1 hypothetical protein D1Z90_00360 [Motilimonas pumila]